MFGSAAQEGCFQKYVSPSHMMSSTRWISTLHKEFVKRRRTTNNLSASVLKRDSSTLAAQITKNKRKLHHTSYVLGRTHTSTAATNEYDHPSSRLSSILPDNSEKKAKEREKDHNKLPVISITRHNNSLSSSSSSSPSPLVHNVSSSSSMVTSSSGTISTPSSFSVVKEQQDLTFLVDEILRETRTLMDQCMNMAVNNHLTTTTTTGIDGADNSPNNQFYHVVAYSGGIDSSLVVALLQRCIRDGNEEILQPIMGNSAAVSMEQIDTAQKVLQHLNLPYTQVQTSEGSEEQYILNEGQACYACKTKLYSTLQQQVAMLEKHVGALQQQQEKKKKDHCYQLYNGTNADDLKDATRVGLIAAQNHNVASPLARINKQTIRRIAKHLGLPNWNMAASPCLRSRLALGVSATAEHLQRIEKAERYVRQLLSHVIQESTNLRVRQLSKNRARIEVDADILPYCTTTNNNNNHQNNYEYYYHKLSNYLENELGFDSIQIQAFRSGSVST